MRTRTRTAIKHILALFLITPLILGTVDPPPAVAQAPLGSHLRVLESNDKAILLELTVDDFTLETVEREGQTYHRLVIPGTAQTATPGEPQVPTRGALLGLPTAEGVSLEILEAEHETLSGYRLLPAPGRRLIEADENTLLAGRVEQFFTLDRDLYATDAFYPGQLTELDEIGYLRDQAVAQVRFCPAQVNPVTGQVHLYRRILIRLTWDWPVVTANDGTRGVALSFDNLLHDTLLNYDAPERTAALPPSVAHSSAPIAATTAATPTLKIAIAQDGIYQLTRADLVGAGLDLTGSDPRTIKVRHRGVEIPIYVPGEDDGTFDAADSVLFYGTAIDDLYTSENVYWLTAGGTPGQRMEARNGTPGGATVPAHFLATMHAEQDTYYWQSMPDGEGQDHWFWGDRLTAPATQSVTATLHNVSTTASTATVRARLKGRTSIGAVFPDHHTRLYLNGTQIDDQVWDDQAIYDHEVTVAHNLLNEGDNVIRVESVGDTGAVVDQIHVNWIELDYWDAYVAENDQLCFGPPAAGTYQFQVSQFTDSDVQVFDVTDSAHAAILTGTTTVADGGRYTLHFQDSAGAGTRYLALTSAQHKSPARIVLDQPSSWKSPTNGADYVIIAHEDFYASAQRLALHRQDTSGLRAATVKIDDVYDEFNYGIFNPQAIRDFLAYAYHNWVSPGPAFVVLVGDATHDYKDNLGTGTQNYVPSQIIETDELGQTPSDNWFVLVSGDDILPDMWIGRLGVQSVSQADDVVDKIIRYEQHPPDRSWNSQALLVADDGDTSFKTISEQIAGLLPAHYTAHKVYADTYPPGDPTPDIAAAINAGTIVVNYSGHGHVSGWGQWTGSQYIFERSDIQALDNTHKLPVVTIANCLNGFFTGPQTEVSTAEAFLRLKDRGAVAVWASTGLGYASGHRVLMSEFYETIFHSPGHTLGAATSAAKVEAYTQNSAWGELVQTFVLFGDPATQLYYPYVESTVPADGTSNAPIDQEVQIFFSKPMSTTTVVLSVEGAPGTPFTPTWNTGNTVVTYAHPDLSDSQTLTLTVEGQDEQGSPLGTSAVPTTWSFTVQEAYFVHLPLILRNR